MHLGYVEGILHVPTMCYAFVQLLKYNVLLYRYTNMMFSVSWHKVKHITSDVKASTWSHTISYYTSYRVTHTTLFVPWCGVLCTSALSWRFVGGGVLRGRVPNSIWYKEYIPSHVMCNMWWLSRRLGRVLDRRVDRSVDQSIGRSVDRSIGRSVGRSVGR